MEQDEDCTRNGKITMKGAGKRSGSQGEQSQSKRRRKMGNKHRPVINRDSFTICAHYMNGCCRMESACRFSHAAIPLRKQQLCKHYSRDSCMKGDKCLYMHQNFPCRYFAQGFQCFYGDKCKFSHAELNDTTRKILNEYLASRQKQQTPKDEEEASSQRQQTTRDEGNSSSSKIAEPVDLCTENTYPVISSFYKDTLQDDDSCLSNGEETKSSLSMEIYASETSHPPMEYQLTPVSTSSTNYGSLRFQYSDSQVHNDPRLRKF